MSGSGTDAAARWCREQLTGPWQDFELAARFAPTDKRPGLWALYAMTREIERIPSSVSEAPLGAIRQQWWREAVAEILEGAPIRAHPVVEALAPVLKALPPDMVRMETDRLFDSATPLLTAGSFVGADDLLSQCREEIAPAIRLGASVLSEDCVPPEKRTLDDIVQAMALCRAAQYAAICLGASRPAATAHPPIETVPQRLARNLEPGEGAPEQASLYVSAIRQYGDEIRQRLAGLEPALTPLAAPAALIPFWLYKAEKAARHTAASGTLLRSGSFSGLARRIRLTGVVLTGRF